MAESVLCLRGKGPSDFEELVVKQGGLLLSNAGDEMMDLQNAENAIRLNLLSCKILWILTKKIRVLIENAISERPLL